MEELMKQLREGVAWLDKLQVSNDDATPPDNDVVAAMAAALRLNVVGDAQRDPTAEIPDTVIVPLKNPHKVLAGEGRVLESLAFRTPSFGEIKKIQQIGERKSTTGGLTDMLVMLGEDDLTTADVDKLKSIDVGRCSEALEPFLVLVPRNKPGSSGKSTT